MSGTAARAPSSEQPLGLCNPVRRHYVPGRQDPLTRLQPHPVPRLERLEDALSLLPALADDDRQLFEQGFRHERWSGIKR